MTDDLLAAIAAAPDDDAPRLVWADREGGERGELVVIQCALARHDLARADRKRLAAREKELLAQRGAAWAGVPRARFVRGFVESVTIPLAELLPRVEALFTAWPTLSALGVTGLTAVANRNGGPAPNEAWEAAEHGLRLLFGRLPPDRITSLDISSCVVDDADSRFDSGGLVFFDDRLLAILEAAPSLRRLRWLELTDSALTARHARAISRFGLERLFLGSHRLGGAGCVALLQACPTITRFGACRGTPALSGAELVTLLEAREVSRLEELDLLSNELTDDDLAKIGSSWGLRNLAHLGIGLARVTDHTALRAIERSHHLRNLRWLDLYGIKAGLAAVDEPTFADSLRVLRLHTNTTDLDMFPRLTALERIEASE